MQEGIFEEGTYRLCFIHMQWWECHSDYFAWWAFVFCLMIYMLMRLRESRPVFSGIILQHRTDGIYVLETQLINQN